MPDRIQDRPGAPPTDGLHIAGTTGTFSRHVHERARCPECSALHPYGDEDRLCDGCRRAYAEAEEAALTGRAPWQDGDAA